MTKRTKAKRSDPRRAPVVTALTLTDERPWSPGQPDRLGFEPLAEQLALVLSDPGLRGGFVIGIEGEWGSGKSTLAAQTVEALSKKASGAKVVQFNPWLVGNRSDLLTELFAGIARAVDSIAPQSGDTAHAVEEAKRGVMKLLRRYAGPIRTAAKVAGTVAGAAAPEHAATAEMVRVAAEGIAATSEQPEFAKPLTEQRAELQLALPELNRRIIVFIDDVERLEPTETLEMMRLIRAVGDLPNVVYVVSFDRNVFVRNLELALNMEAGGGSAYLEKIIQATVVIPEPEETALRDWFREEAMSISGLSRGNEAQAKDLERLNVAIEQEGGRQLSTPRDVIRALNGIKLMWPAVRDHVCFGDLVWLHLIRLKEPALHKWIERYLSAFASVATSPRWVTDRGKLAAELGALIDARSGDHEQRYYEIQRYIPGLHRASGVPPEKGRVWALFNLQKTELDAFTRERRLGSPHYSRYYFSLGQHGGSLPTKELTAARDALRAGADKFLTVLRLHAEKRIPNGQLQLAPLLDYLIAHVGDMSDDERARLVLTLGTCMDDVIRAERAGIVSGRCESASEIACTNALRMMPEKGREETFLTLFDQGAALSWLCTILGRAYNEPNNDFRLPLELLKEVGGRLVQKLDGLGVGVFGLPIPGRTLWLFKQVLGEGEEFRGKIAKLTEEDEYLLRALLSVRATISSSEGSWHSLGKKEVGELIEFAAARARVEKMAADRSNVPSSLHAMLDLVVDAIRKGDERTG